MTTNYDMNILFDYHILLSSAQVTRPAQFITNRERNAGEAFSLLQQHLFNNLTAVKISFPKCCYGA